MMSTLLRTIRTTLRPQPHVRRRRLVPALEGLDQRCLLDAGIGYVQTNLVSDIKGLARTFDQNLQNPWGVSQNTEGQFRVADNATGLSTQYSADGQIIGTPVTIPTPTGVTPPSASQRQRFQHDQRFRHQPRRQERSGDRALLIGERHDCRFQPCGRSQRGHSGGRPVPVWAQTLFQTLTAGNVNGANYIYASDFHNGTVDVFNSQFQLVHLSGSFTDPTIPAGFAPFGLQNVVGNLRCSSPMPGRTPPGTTTWRARATGSSTSSP